MGNEINKITDRKLIYEIFDKRFKTGKIFIKTNDLNIQVESFLIENEEIHITLSAEYEKINSVIFYIRDHEEVVFCHATLKSKNENGVLIYDPRDIQILPIPRKEERKSIVSVETPDKVHIYISNIISDFTIHECLTLSRRRADSIREELLKKINHTYPDSEIVFLNEKPKDNRMVYCKKERKPYFIKNISDIYDIDKLRSADDLKYYNSFIHQIEPISKKAKNVSEICVPLLYKMMMPFGYIKSLSTTELSEEDFSVIRKFGMSASTVYTNDKQIIISSEDHIAVTDLSMSGLGIFFKDKTLIKHFKENSLIVFTIYLPEKKQATVLCEVRNIALIKNYIYRIGCQIMNIEALGEVYYEEYLEGLVSK